MWKFPGMNSVKEAGFCVCWLGSNTYFCESNTNHASKNNSNCPSHLRELTIWFPTRIPLALEQLRQPHIKPCMYNSSAGFCVQALPHHLHIILFPYNPECWLPLGPKGENCWQNALSKGILTQELTFSCHPYVTKPAFLLGQL